jgi:tRNA 2-thiouridine synthesizing protein E
MIERMHSTQANNPSTLNLEAPSQWNFGFAESIARSEGLILVDSHLEVIYALHHYFATHDKPEINMRVLHDALEEKFYHCGGMKYLYGLFPGGPVAQGCRLAGLEVPAGAVDKSFGSVQ